MPVRKKVDIPIDIPLPIVFDDSFSVFKYSSSIRVCHVYNDGWQLTVCDDSLHCAEEEDNEYDKHAAAIIYDSFCSNKVLGHAPLYWSELANNFLKFPNNYICFVITGKGGIGLGLEIPVDFFFHEDNRVIECFKKSIEKPDKCTNAKVEKCIK